MAPQKLRRPGTWAHCVEQVKAVYGAEEAAEIAGCTRGQVYDWADPDTPRQATLRCSLAWDLKLMRDGHEPLFFTLYRERLDLDAIGPAGAVPIDPIEATTVAVRECAEAVNAYLMTSQLRAPSNTERTMALQEIDEAVQALQRLAKAIEHQGAVPASGIKPIPLRGRINRRESPTGDGPEAA